MHFRTLIPLIAAAALFAGPAAAAEHPELHAFPAAPAGQQKLVIVLEHKERSDEGAFQVELIPAKRMLTDGVNLLRLGSTIAPRPLQGWGYTYYEVTGSDRVMSTMMGVPEGAEKVEQLVRGTPLMIRYNSRLPIVIYAPQGYEVEYRVWSDRWHPHESGYHTGNAPR